MRRLPVILLDDGAYAFTWDGAGRLIEVAPKSPSTGDKMVVYEYDYMSRRKRRQVIHYNGSAWETGSPDSDTIYVNHSMQCLEELDNLNSDLPVRAYAWGLDVAGRLDLADSPFVSMAGAGGVGGLLCMVTAESGKVGTYQMTYDGNGNIVKLLNASGAQMVLYRYGPFGEDLLNVPHYVYNPFRFSTKFHETALAGNNTVPPELYDYGFRWYHAGLGRWTVRDPIGEAGGYNLVSFVKNEPNDLVDIHGRDLPLLGRKLTGHQIPFAVGVTLNFLAGATFSSLTPLADLMPAYLPDSDGDVFEVPNSLHLGAGVSLMFFPDSCEIAGYNVFAGIGRTAGLKAKSIKGLLGNVDNWETVAHLGIGAGVEMALYLGDPTPGNASAERFAGYFYTAQFSLPVPNAPAPNGFSGYYGIVNRPKAYWIGGTTTIGVGIGLGVLVWDYRPAWRIDLKSIKGGMCFCYATIAALPHVDYLPNAGGPQSPRPWRWPSIPHPSIPFDPPWWGPRIPF